MDQSVFQKMIKSSSRVADLVSSPERVDQKTRNVLLPTAARAALVEAAHLAAERRLAAGTLAELSQRLAGDRFAITAREVWFPGLTEDDFNVISVSSGRVLLENPPAARHAEWHRAVYRLTGAGAVLLCQPLAAFKAAARPVTLNPDLAPVMAGLRWCEPDEAAIAAGVPFSSALLLTGCGLLVWGANFREAAGLAESIEFCLQAQAD
jgi:ribulose-5-phosphate 4-epimerase/fuculose-1-phosphate aldolase